jgi:hypothetical protein
MVQNSVAGASQPQQSWGSGKRQPLGTHNRESTIPESRSSWDGAHLTSPASLWCKIP